MQRVGSLGAGHSAGPARRSHHRKAFHRCLGCGHRFKGLRSPAPKRCRNCRSAHHAAATRARWAGRKKYVWTPEHDEMLRARYDGHVKGRAAELAAEIGYPCWVVKRRAEALGLTAGWSPNRRPWTIKEEDFLLEHAGRFSLDYMARKLRRPRGPVATHLKRMLISYRAKEGYTMRALEVCFGVDHHTIRRWIDAGWLPNRRRDNFEPNEVPERRSMCIRDDDLARFIREHPSDFELRRVDQAWFMRLVLSGRGKASPTIAPGDDEDDADLAADL